MMNYWFILFIEITIFFIDIIPGQTALLSSIGKTITNEFYDESQKFGHNNNEEIVAALKIVVYQGPSNETMTTTSIPISKPEVIYQRIDHAKQLAIYIHGYREYLTDENIQTIVAVYLKRGTHNIFVLDWSKLAWDNYITVISRIKIISQIFANLFDRLIELGVDIKDTHLIGHSLGAHIAGFTGSYTKYTVPRITALDPAGPGFYHPGAEHINRANARFVDVIHTDGGFYGTSVNTGTVDIFPNGGTRPQPGCEIIGPPLSLKDLCSHRRSWQYWAESVINSSAFKATCCNTYVDYKLGKCQYNPTAYVGHDIPTNLKGTYYLLTNAESPYGESDSSSS